MSIILTKSPYIITVNEAGQIGSKVEVFMYATGASVPTYPQYTLSKLISSSTSPSTYYDISPYINEYINYNSYTINTSTVNLSTNTSLYTNVVLKKYKLIGSTYTLFETIAHTAFKGYALEEDGINIDYGQYLLDEGTYYYQYDSTKTSATLPAGDMIFKSIYNIPTNTYMTCVYTDLVTGATTTNNYTSTDWKTIYRVHPTYWANGNKLEIKAYEFGDLVSTKTYYFKPKDECKYMPVILDFINRYGSWQREFLFKASIDSLNVENQSYKAFKSVPTTFNEQESLNNTFNTNGTLSIKCNTGWVDESFKQTIKELMLSDRILINNRPAILKTKQVELQKNINNRNINYSLDFDFANYVI